MVLHSVMSRSGNFGPDKKEAVSARYEYMLKNIIKSQSFCAFIDRQSFIVLWQEPDAKSFGLKCRMDAWGAS